jgi:hypothetical protein
MASKFRAGQRLVLNGGKEVEVVGVARSIHGNTSQIQLKDAATGEEWPRPVRTAWLSKASRAVPQNEPSDCDTCGGGGCPECGGENENE